MKSALVCFPVRSLSLLWLALFLCPAGVRAQGGVSGDGAYTWSTLAGVPGSEGTTDGGPGAKMYLPAGVCVDTDGTVYAVDFWSHTVRKIAPDGTLSTFAGSPGSSGSADGDGGSARFYFPNGITIDADGTLYVTDNGNHTIRKITPQGLVTTLAGKAGQSGYADGQGEAARFNSPDSLSMGPPGVIYVADTSNHCIRAVTTAGAVTTFAGKPGDPGSNDAEGGNSRFNHPTGIAFNQESGDGDVMVCDFGNQTIRLIYGPFRQTRTVAGRAGMAGHADGLEGTSRISGPYNICWAGTDTYYVTSFDGHTIRRLEKGDGLWTLHTLGGTGGAYGTADGAGPSARFNKPLGIAVSPGGVIYVGDYQNHRVSAGRAKPQRGQYHWAPVAGGRVKGTADGTGLRARFSAVTGVAADAAGNVYIADADSHTIRKVSAAGQVTTLAGSPGFAGSNDGTGVTARFNLPLFIAIDPAGTLFVTDAQNHLIRAVSPAGVVSTIAGTPGEAGTRDGNRTTARLNTPYGITVLPNGNLAVADHGTAIRIVTRDGTVTTLAGVSGQQGRLDGTGTAARFQSVLGLATDRSGTIFACDTGGPTIRTISPSGSVLTVAGRPDTRGTADGTGIDARFNSPIGIAPGPDGNFYITESSPGRVRRMTPDFKVTTLGGSLDRYGIEGGPGNAARLGLSIGIAAGADGALYIGNHTMVTVGVPYLSGSMVRQPGGGNRVLFGADALSGYELQRNTGLHGSWTPLGTFVAPANGAVSFTDPSPPATRAFYRLHTLFSR